MKKLLNVLVAVSIGFMAFLGCEETESYSEIPEIEFSKYRVYDTIYPSFDKPVRAIDIIFKFVDGDGDLGDTTKEQNLFFRKFEQINGEFINKDTSLLFPLSIPYSDKMRRDGQNKTLKGTIKVLLEQYNVMYDTIRYEFYLFDRAGNKSNIATTAPIVGLKK